MVLDEDIDWLIMSMGWDVSEPWRPTGPVYPPGDVIV
jgi:hypothetical protein